jgi:tetratricopeptide (TPR) repeat protein
MGRKNSGDYGKARVLLMSGRYEDALGELKRVLRGNPRDVDALYQMARLRLEMGKEMRARKLFGKCARLDARGKWSREIVSQLKRGD